MFRELHSSPSQPCRALETGSGSQSLGGRDKRIFSVVGAWNLNPAALKEYGKRKRCIGKSRFPWKHESKTGIHLHLHLRCSELPVWLTLVQGLPAHLHLEAIIPTWGPGPWSWSKLTMAQSTKFHGHYKVSPCCSKPAGQEEHSKKEQDVDHC